MAWKATGESAKLIRLLAGMCYDALAGMGVDRWQTFVANLRRIATAIEESPAQPSAPAEKGE